MRDLNKQSSLEYKCFTFGIYLENILSVIFDDDDDYFSLDSYYEMKLLPPSENLTHKHCFSLLVREKTR